MFNGRVSSTQRKCVRGKERIAEICEMGKEMMIVVHGTLMDFSGKRLACLCALGRTRLYFGRMEKSVGFVPRWNEKYC
jgi:hypothetical protein